MAFTSHEASRVAKNEDFQGRVLYYMVRGAASVIAEDPVANPGHAARKAYADLVLDNTAPVEMHALAALNNPTVAAGGDYAASTDGAFGILDEHLEFAVNEYWNAMSGHETG